jgi:hypothetical protein
MITFIIWVTRISELGMLGVTSNRRMLVSSNIPSSLILTTVMMEAIPSSVTFVLTRAAWRNIPEDGILHSHHRENLKSYDYESSCFKHLMASRTPRKPQQTQPSVDDKYQQRRMDSVSPGPSRLHSQGDTPPMEHQAPPPQGVEPLSIDLQAMFTEFAQELRPQISAEVATEPVVQPPDQQPQPMDW